MIEILEAIPRRKRKKNRFRLSEIKYNLELIRAEFRNHLLAGWSPSMFGGIGLISMEAYNWLTKNDYEFQKIKYDLCDARRGIKWPQEKKIETYEKPLQMSVVHLGSVKKSS